MGNVIIILSALIGGLVLLAAYMTFLMWIASRRASRTGDKSIGGAYVGLFMLTAPVVFILGAMLATALVFRFVFY